MDIAGKRILVSGGGGFIGSHVVDQLADCSVCVLDDFSTGKEENLAEAVARGNVKIVHGDIRERQLATQLLKNVDVVFHLACRGVRHSLGNPFENHQVNAEGTLTLLGAAHSAGVKRFVHISSSEVYGTARYAPMDELHPTLPETVYGAAKLAGEAYARAYHQTYGLPTVVVRPFNNFGPRSHHEGDSGEVIPRFVVWALNGKPPVIFGDGHQTRDFIYVTETAYWLRRVAQCDDLVGSTVNLGSGHETSIRELATIVYQEAGASELVPCHHPPRPGDVRRHLAGVEIARRAMGFSTRTSVREGIRRLIQHTRAATPSPSALLADTTVENWRLTGECAT